jgi:hypothetical protein
LVSGRIAKFGCPVISEISCCFSGENSQMPKVEAIYARGKISENS